MAYALAEMAVVHPQAGSFGVYAERYLSPWFGFVVRATYGFIQIVAIGAEVTAVAIYFAFWFPAVPPWLWVAGASVALIAINTARVSRFGEVEYWFALVKVVAILAFIVVGLMLILGIGTVGLAGRRLSQPHRRTRRFSAERLEGRVAGADARHHELHGRRGRRGDGRRSAESRDVDSARDADDGAPADHLLHPGGHASC